MEDLDTSLPLKRPRPRFSNKYKMIQNEPKASTITQPSLETLQNNHILNNSIGKLQNSTWKYFTTKGLPKNTFDSYTLELLKIATKHFILSEVEYIAVISLLQQEKVHLLNISKAKLIDLCCFAVKLQMESNKTVLNLLFHNLRNLYKSFETIIDEILLISTVRVKELNTIYYDFQKIMIQEINYNVKVGEIVRNSTPYNKKIKLVKKKGECINEDNGGISNISKYGGLEEGENNFSGIAPIEKQKRKVLKPKSKILLDSCYNFFNNHEFDNGYYAAQDFESIV